MVCVFPLFRGFHQTFQSLDIVLFRGWKLNNMTSFIHYYLGVSSDYSLFSFMLVIHDS